MAFCAVASTPPVATAAEVRWRQKSGYKTAPQPIAADMDLDRRMEIIQVDMTGRVMLLDAEDGKVIWERHLGEHTLMTPIAGHFMGDGRISIIVPTVTGELFVLDGPTGAILGNQSYSCGYPLSLPATSFPIQEDNPVAPYREGIILYDHNNQRLLGYQISQGRGLETIFQFDVKGELKTPPAIGTTKLAAAAPHATFVTTSGRLYVISTRETGKVATANLERRCEMGLTLANLDQTPALEVVIADKSGYLHALGVQGNTFVPVWRDAAGNAVPYRSILSQPDKAPVAVDVDGDGADDLVIPRKGGLMLLNGATGLSFWNPAASILEFLAYPHEIQTPLAVFRDETRRAFVVLGDELGAAVFDLRARTVDDRMDIGSSAVITPLVGDFSGEGEAQVFLRTRADGTAHLIDLGKRMSPENPPWVGLRGGPGRGSVEPREEHAFRLAQTRRLGERLEAVLSRAREMTDQGEWDLALQSIDIVLGINPNHREALKLRRYAYFRAHLILIVLFVLLSLSLLGYLGYLAAIHSRRILKQTLAAKALASGDKENAAVLLKQLIDLYPRQRSNISQLANLYIDLKKFDAKTSVIFEKAHELFPKEDRYLKALATAYSSIPRMDATAAQVYGQMARLANRPGPWFFLLGQALLATDKSEEALEAFRQTIINQYDEPQLPKYMADLYVKLNITAPEVLPTLDRVLDDHKDDRAFLKTYCQACQEARRYDEQTQQVASWLLEQDPASPQAHIILATRLLQSGQNKEAMLHAEQVLQVSPNDSIGLRLLGGCYAAERRLDATAMQIFAKALESNPQAPDILLAVSHGYIQEQRDDSEARDVYKKALVHSPSDETILQHLARIAVKESDDDLTIRTIEPLMELGKQTREMTLHLANAYCRQGIVEDKAEPIYRKALVHQPDHATIQENLAAIYLRKGRTDLEALKIFESAFGRHPERFDLGLQLVRCYHDNHQPEKALELGSTIQPIGEDNPELQKLMASSSQNADQMESAIEGFEQVLQANADDQDAICALSGLYGQRHRDDNQAIEIYNQAIQINPQESSHYIAAARAYGARDSWEHVVQIIRTMMTQAPASISAAIALMSELTEQAPRVMELRWFLIDTLIFEGRLLEARNHTTEALRIDPTQSERTLESLDRILEKNARDALSHLERGKLLLALNRERDARQAMEKAHRLEPSNDLIARNLMKLYEKLLEERDSAELRFHLGQLAMRLDRHDLAISCFQATGRDYRWEGESRRNLARCFMAKGMLDLSLQELKQLPMEPDVKELLYELGQRYESVADIQGAREVYKLIFANDINFKDVKGKLETLLESGGDAMVAERTAIINALSEDAKQRYELVQELGRGAMGIVYKARDNELDEMVALKILPDNLIRNPEAVRRFKQEARSARRLAHPNIVRIHDIGEELGRKYISMEFVDGSDLKQKLRLVNRKLPFEAALRYARQICEAMAYAHSIGIVHRDIKPANLMLTREDVLKVTDFGIAKIMESTKSGHEDTMAGVVIGTPLYMSPEQVKGQQVDHRADIYSMGVVFYELANGRPPFTEGDLSYQHLFAEPKPLKNAPEAYANVVMKCLAKVKEERWQSAQEILDELNKIDG